MQLAQFTVTKFSGAQPGENRAAGTAAQGLFDAPEQILPVLRVYQQHLLYINAAGLEQWRVRDVRGGNESLPAALLAKLFHGRQEQAHGAHAIAIAE